jgi:hypothetical protein
MEGLGRCAETASTKFQIPKKQAEIPISKRGSLCPGFAMTAGALARPLPSETIAFAG